MKTFIKKILHPTRRFIINLKNSIKSIYFRTESLLRLVKPLKIEKNHLTFKVGKTCNEGFGWWTNNYPTWENHTFEIFDKFLNKEMIFFDIGTFSGHTTLYAAQKVKSVFGVDLDPMAYKACLHNIKINKYKNVQIEHTALANKSGETFIDEGTIGSSGCHMSKNGSVKVDSKTIEELMSIWNINKCDFIKMDIEGGEENCLPAMKKFFETYKPILFLSVHKHLGAKPQTIVDSTIDYEYVYDSKYENVKDSLYETIMSRGSGHSLQDYLFTNKPVKFDSR
jgi:FkbM family methyltransferase